MSDGICVVCGCAIDGPSYTHEEEISHRGLRDCIATLTAENERLRAHVHPWYGPCDGMAGGGECAECERVSKWKWPADVHKADVLADTWDQFRRVADQANNAEARVRDLEAERERAVQARDNWREAHDLLQARVAALEAVIKPFVARHRLTRSDWPHPLCQECNRWWHEHDEFCLVRRLDAALTPPTPRQGERG